MKRIYVIIFFSSFLLGTGKIVVAKSGTAAATSEPIVGPLPYVLPQPTTATLFVDPDDQNTYNVTYRAANGAPVICSISNQEGVQIPLAPENLVIILEDGKFARFGEILLHPETYLVTRIFLINALLLSTNEAAEDEHALWTNLLPAD